jgi:hypothetical protein
MAMMRATRLTRHPPDFALACGKEMLSLHGKKYILLPWPLPPGAAPAGESSGDIAHPFSLARW